MAVIFILLGSLLGFLTAIVTVLTGALPILGGLALWAASGPAAVALCLGLQRLARMQRTDTLHSAEVA